MANVLISPNQMLIHKDHACCLKLLCFNFTTFNIKFEPHRDKTNKMACAPSEDSDQPSLIRVFAVRLMGS